MTTHEILKKYWNFNVFRSSQEDVIQSVLNGRDTLALLPTGGGKSICFQVPALSKPGICVVVSPLIALMKDQIENLKARQIEAVAIFSGMGKREIDILLDNCIYGPVKFLYLSPERLLSDLVRERISHMNVNLLVVDEAHCISQWGYDFRPSYLHINKLREIHPKIPVLALTATATQRVVVDIQEKLNFSISNIIRKSFERKNLAYAVLNEENKLKRLVSILKKVKGSGIVYVRNRRETQEVARLLSQQKIISDFYHAGLDILTRTKKQQSWKNNQTRIIVATNAFGMGIDKPDVRFVVHLDLPESLEAYYQEAGRAGRDEEKAFAILLYNNSDRVLLLKKLTLSFPEIEEIKKVYHQLGNYFQLAYGAGDGLTFEFDLADFCSRFQFDVVKTLNALKFLEHDEYITLIDRVYLPSRAKIIVSAEDMYRFQIENEFYDGFLKILLRSYGGLFEQYVPIEEADLAKRTGHSKADVEVILKKLEEFGILSYLKQTDKPQVQYVKARVHSENLYIDYNYIKARKDIAATQISSVINYAEGDICRNRVLLLYFGDKVLNTCGVCDICLEQLRRSPNDDVIDSITEELLQVLSDAHFTLDELVPALRHGTEKQRVDVIRFLLDSGKIKCDGKTYYL